VINKEASSKMVGFSYSLARGEWEGTDPFDSPVSKDGMKIRQARWIPPSYLKFKLTNDPFIMWIDYNQCDEPKINPTILD
jgi:hypothetical protein